MTFSCIISHNLPLEEKLHIDFLPTNFHQLKFKFYNYYKNVGKLLEADYIMLHACHKKLRYIVP